MKPTFFRTPAEFRRWLERHHDTAPELWVGFHKKGSGKPSITYPEALDEALCFGWIDGVRKSIDDTSYVNRFTPRRPRSNWSAVNVKRVEELTKQGRMRPSGLEAFAARDPERTAVYSYEQRKFEKLSAAYETKLKMNKAAWAFFRAQAPWYQRAVSRWVMSAKREETRLSRLATLIDDSARQRRIGILAQPAQRR
jgi:uncharacterized protein YdeI (YjbR/CyaY-like superfamily)